MKNIIVFLLLFAVGIQYNLAQTVPQGMKYQAVARDASGEILANQKIILQINLAANGEVGLETYQEEHEVVTSHLGLFTLDIGQGKVQHGQFNTVPWSDSEIWMEIKIKKNEQEDFLTISNSKMLSVPYAFHAATASEIVFDQNLREPGVPSQNWSLFGNSTSDPEIDKLGTTDGADLVIVTNNIERIRIIEDGDVQIVKSVNIGNDLTVEDNVYLNTVDGETINNGPFTVDNKSPTSLTGSLTVFNQEPTLLSGTLTVDLATDLNASLNVDGVTNLNSALNVNNGSPTKLTGTLLVNDNATFNQYVLLDNASLGSTSPSTGNLVVSGGLGVGENLNIGGSAAFGGPVNFMSPVTITASEESTSTTSGALIVTGGTGIGKRLNVGGATNLGSSLNVIGATTLNNTLNVSNATALGGALTVTGVSQFNNNLGVTGVTNLTNATQSNSASTGALIVNGGAGIGGNLNIGGSFNVTKDGGTGHVASFVNTANGNGISIKVGASTPHNNNNFITFYNNGGATVGRIEGENGSADLANNREYQDDKAFLITDIVLQSASEAIAIVEEIQAIVEVVASATSITVCVGLGICVTSPVPSLIVSSAANLIVQTANLIVETANLAKVIANLVVFENTHAALFGITFASGAEDYAEYLPKLNPDEMFLPGDLVGIKNGFITKNTSDVDRIMVISHKPAVLGGLPPDEKTDGYEIVAFMGQVPTRVLGEVSPGDYILPSGYHNGFGVGKKPELMRAKDYKDVLGIAWEANDGIVIGMVNTAIGLNSNDLAKVLAEQENLIAENKMTLANMELQIMETDKILSELVPGFADASSKQKNQSIKKTIAEKQDVHEGHNHAFENTDESFSKTAANHNLTEVAPDDIVYFPVEREYLEEALAMAEDAFRQTGIDLNEHPFWKRIYSDLDYKEELFNDIGDKLKTAVHTHNNTNTVLSNTKK